jgi:hypothetical protein
MATHDDIVACLDQAAAEYAARKHQGGNNGSKGGRYEDFFLTYKVVQMAAEIVSLERPDNPHIKGQDFGFVDDVRIATEDSTQYFQLKNKVTISWAASDHPLEDDFAMQYKLAMHLKEAAPKTTLVVSTNEQKAALTASIPENIAAHTNVYHFPWTETANRLVLEDSQLQVWLRQLANHPNASLDALAGVFGMLMVAHINMPQGAHIEDLMKAASNCHPGVIRLLPFTQHWQEHLKLDFTKILATIPGLLYSADRGFFRWSGFGTSGIFGSSVLSRDFMAFQDEVIRIAPKTFEDFEGVLP